METIDNLIIQNASNYANNRSLQVRTGQIKSAQIKSGQFKSGKAMSGKVMLCQVISSWLCRGKSDPVRSGLV